QGARALRHWVVWISGQFPLNGSLTFAQLILPKISQTGAWSVKESLMSGNRVVISAELCVSLNQPTLSYLVSRISFKRPLKFSERCLFQPKVRIKTCQLFAECARVQLLGQAKLADCFLDLITPISAPEYLTAYDMHFGELRIEPLCLAALFLCPLQPDHIARLNVDRH